MSLAALSWVLEERFGSATRKLVMYGLANHAHKDGRNAWCSVPTLAEYAECDTRTVQRHITALITAGWIREGDQSVIPDNIPKTSRPICYDLAMSSATAARWAARQASGLRAVSAQAGSAGGRVGAAARWAPSDDKMSPPENDPEPITGGDTGGDIGGDMGVTQTKEPLSYGENQEPLSSDVAVAPPDDVATQAVALCELLAQLIVENGSNKPPITKRWLDAARLMLTRDGRDYAKAQRLVTWCQADEFWRSNVMSMPKFREQYDQLRLKALEDWNRRNRPAANDIATSTQRVMDLEALREHPRGPQDPPRFEIGGVG